MIQLLGDNNRPDRVGCQMQGEISKGTADRKRHSGLASDLTSFKRPTSVDEVDGERMVFLFFPILSHPMEEEIWLLVI